MGFLSTFVQGLEAILTTKGDILSFSSVRARLGVGSNNQVLTADSAQALGVKWATPSSEVGTDLTTKGDIHGYDTEQKRIPIGSNNQVLTADSAQALGVKWATTGGGSLELIETYTAGSAESSKTFSFTAIDFSTVSELILEFDMSPTLVLGLLAQINGSSSSNYYMSGKRIADSVETLLDENTGSSWQIATTNACSGVNVNVTGKMSIRLSSSGTLKFPMYRVFNVSINASGIEEMGGTYGVATASIDEVTILTSTSSWATGARMSLYKVNRA